jgi:hypothetical protein
MREITTRVYRFEELAEEAQQRAVENVAVKLGGDWWDSHDTDDLRDVMVYAFAAALGEPGQDTFGPGDYPGIPGVKLTEWDLDRGQSVKFEGTLDADNAPNLPWAGGLEQVVLNHRHYVRSVWVEVDGPDDDALTRQRINAMREAVEEATHKAWKAGRDELDHRTSSEYAREWIEINELEFTEDGELFA